MSPSFPKIKKITLFLIFLGAILPFLNIQGIEMTKETESSGALPDPEVPWILTTAGEIVPGMVGKMSEEAFFFQSPNDWGGNNDARGWETIRRKNVAAILYRPPIEPDYAPIWLKKHLNWPNTGMEKPGKDDQLLLVNNDHLAVHILSLDDKKVHFMVSGVKKPLSLPIRRIRAIKFGQ